MKRIFIYIIFILCLIHITEIRAKNPMGFSTPAPPVMPSVPTIPDRADSPQMPTMKPFPTIKLFPTMKSVPTAKPTGKSGESSDLAPYGEEKKPDNSSGLEPYGQEPVSLTPSGVTSGNKPDDLVPFGETPSSDKSSVPKTEPEVEPYEPETPAPQKVKPAPTQKEEVVPFEPDSSPGAAAGQTGEVEPYEPGRSDANAVHSDPDKTAAPASPSPEAQVSSVPSGQDKGIKALKDIPMEFYIGAAVMIVFPVLIYFLSRKKKL